jgi:hypothetical protein
MPPSNGGELFATFEKLKIIWNIMSQKTALIAAYLIAFS